MDHDYALLNAGVSALVPGYSHYKDFVVDGIWEAAFTAHPLHLKHLEWMRQHNLMAVGR
jgi:hypothetical protein